jgi:hypothetical protein
MARAGRSDDGRARCLRRACRCADVSGRDLSGERQLARTQQQKQKRRQETTGWEGRPAVGGDKTWEEEVSVGLEMRSECVCVEVRRRVVRAGVVLSRKRVWGVWRLCVWVVLRGWAYGGPGEGWSDPRDARGRACRSKAESRGRAHFTCGSLSWPVVHIAKAKGENKVRPWKLAVEALRWAIPTTKHSTKAATRR